MTPTPELIVSRVSFTVFIAPVGTWLTAEDPTAADGVRFHDPDKGAQKLTAPRAQPANYLDVQFAADPTQIYKLWIRAKAQNDFWGNDSVFVQFSGATDRSGTPVYRIGTTSGLAVNLEECVGCGLSKWGWRDERWGATLHAEPVLLRFPQGGFQRIIIQSREDGISIDQIVFSAETYRTRSPGTAKNDTTIVK